MFKVKAATGDRAAIVTDSDGVLIDPLGRFLN